MQCAYLDAVPQFDKIFLLVRHAERAEITDLRQGPLSELTEAGKTDAKLFGMAIPPWSSELLAIHSPYPRCRQTAEKIVEGAVEAGHKATLGSAVEWLTAPFPDSDRDFISEMARSIGYDTVLRKWYDGQLPSDRIKPSRQVARTQLANIIQYVRDARSCITMGVTHDWRISILFEHFLGLRFEDAGMPGLLDSIAVLFRAGRTMLWYQGRSAEVAAQE